MTDDRRTRIGGSDVAAIMGDDSRKSAVELYLEKRGEIARDNLDDKPWIVTGRRMEKTLLDFYAEDTGRALTRKVRVTHPALPYFCGELDAHSGAIITPDERIVDAKNVGWYMTKKWGQPDDGDIPVEIFWQMLAYMEMTGMRYADLAMMAAGAEFRIYPVDDSPSLRAAMMDAIPEFWRRVQIGDPPAPKSEDDCRSLWQRSRGITVSATETALDAWRELRLVKASLKELEAQEGALKAVLMAEIQDAEILLGPDGQTIATWKSNKDGQTFDTKALQVAEPEVYNRYLKDKSGNRPLLIKEPKR